MLRSTHRRSAGGAEQVQGGTSVNADTVQRWLEQAAASLREQRDYLTQLDAAIGDADHGTNMDRGFTAVVAKLGQTDGTVLPGKLLTTAGGTLVSTVGGASGPLWGTALRRAGRVLGDAEEFGSDELVSALDAALEGVVELGAAHEGEKTMVDALAPAVRTLRESLAGGASLPDAVQAAFEASEEGMRATVPLQASKGRASYLGERSIGHQDPGATSTTLILGALASTVSAEK
jgi:phosphoenolpyruvate---glycerone phosphotransferase subunit DhaL